jgi:hypothetical protein
MGKIFDAIEEFHPLGKDKKFANIILDLLMILSNLFPSLL